MNNRQQSISNKGWVRALLLLCAILFPCSSHAATSRSKIIVVVANRLLLSDINNPALPTISKILHESGVALISQNCVGPKFEPSVLLTANAGSPCIGGKFSKSYVGKFYNSVERTPDGMIARDSFALRTGYKAPAGSAVFLELGQAQRDNAALTSAPTKLGALGDALHKAGLKTEVVGNADIAPDVIDRSVAVLAMDSRGIVDIGRLTNYSGSLLQNKALSILPSPLEKYSDFTVICFGDFAQLDGLKASMSDSAYAMHKAAALKKLDNIAHDLISQPGSKNTTLILVSFSPPLNGPWNQLTPVVVYSGKEPGLLASPTTRTPGLIAASDFAPTVLNLTHLPASEDMIGRAAHIVQNKHAVETLTDMSTRVTANERLITPIAVFLACMGVLLFTTTAIIVAFRLKASKRIAGLLKIGFTAGACSPAALLLAALAPAGTVGYTLGTILSIVTMTIVCMILGATFGRKMKVQALPIVIAFAISVFIILTDAVTGCNLCKFSALSSYQVTGMRFYGVGNEYAGFLLSMSALAALMLRDKKWLLPITGLLVIIALGLGNVGANYGATAAAVVTFGLLWLAASRGHFSARHVVFTFVAAIAVVVAFAIIDFKLAGAAGTHAARATGLTERLGGGYLSSLALRKVLFNLKIMFSDTGLRAIVAFIPFLALWFWGVQGKAKDIFKDDTRVWTGLKAVLIGAAAAFALNDSGIVFAGIMIAMTVLVLLYSLLEGITPCPEP